MQWQKKLYQHEENPPTVIWDEFTKVLADAPYKISNRSMIIQLLPLQISGILYILKLVMKKYQ